MAWVTWCQDRPALIGVPALFAALAILMLVEGLKIHHDYTALFSCHPVASSACQNLSNSFGSGDWHVGDSVNIVLQLAPALVGAFAGVPVLARELETGTFRYAWTQGIGRERWTIGKVVLLAVVFAVSAGMVSQLNSWFYQPFAVQQNMTRLSAAVFDTQGIVLAAWVLVGFTLGAFFGMLFRRIIPAMIVTLAAYCGIDLLTWQYLRPHYPVSGFWPAQFFEASWLLALSVLLVAAIVWLARHRAA
jgi:ABC-type transport system involved in multi-copper enzyme maturation permease subunit